MTSEMLDGFRLRHAKETLPRVHALIEQTELRAIEDLATRFTYQPALVEAGPRGRAVSLLFAKGVAQLWEFSGCMRAGSLGGAWHHSRTMIELIAMTNYLFVSPPDAATEDERVERLLEWRDASCWLRWEHARLRFEASDKGAAEQEALRIRTYPDPPGIVDADEHTVARWAELYGDGETPEKRLKSFRRARTREWHSPKRLQELIDALGPELAMRYDLACNCSHFSPLGSSLVHAATDGPILGWAPKQGIFCVQFMLAHALDYFRLLGAPGDPATVDAFERASAACRRIVDADPAFRREGEAGR